MAAIAAGSMRSAAVTRTTMCSRRRSVSRSSAAGPVNSSDDPISRWVPIASVWRGSTAMDMGSLLALPSRAATTNMAADWAKE